VPRQGAPPRVTEKDGQKVGWSPGWIQKCFILLHGVRRRCDGRSEFLSGGTTLALFFTARLGPSLFFPLSLSLSHPLPLCWVTRRVELRRGQRAAIGIVGSGRKGGGALLLGSRRGRFLLSKPRIDVGGSWLASRQTKA